jgi:hypothetical protein
MLSHQTNFICSPFLIQVCEVMSPHVLFLLSNQLIRDYQNVQAAQPVAPEGGSMSGAHSIVKASSVAVQFRATWQLYPPVYSAHGPCSSLLIRSPSRFP